jgi:subfamily B ATP-binding cassette protein MsbA
MDPEKKPRKTDMKRAWAEARALMWQHRRSLAIGLALMLVSRLASMVLPFSTKYIIDDVLGDRQTQLLLPIALWPACYNHPAITSFSLSQVVSIAAERTITNMRIEVEHHAFNFRLVLRLGQTGQLISDHDRAEGSGTWSAPGSCSWGGLFPPSSPWVLLYLSCA